MLTLNLLYISLFVITIAAAAVITEGLSLKSIINKEIGRGILNLVAAVSTAAAVKVINDRSILLLSASIGTIFTFAAVRYGIFSQIKDLKRKSWGVFFFALAFLSLLLLFPNDNDVIFLSMLTIGVSGTSSAIVKTVYPKGKSNLSFDSKSISSSTAFFIASLFLFILLFNWSEIFQGLSLSYFIAAILIISLLITVIEALASFGLENLYVPLFTAILFELLLTTTNWDMLLSFITGVILAAIVAFFSYRAKFLTLSGSVATFLLAGFIFGLGGVKWSVPIISFFILSSLLSKFRKKKNEEVEMFFEKTGVRDHWQVAANGGIGGILVIINSFYSSDIIYLTYLASLAAVCADTWATEIGTLKKTDTYNILNFKPIEQGTSGGISVMGSLGALLGATVIFLSGVYWLTENVATQMFIIVFAGLFGSFFDSLLGATMQAQNKCNVCGKITERDIHCGNATDHHKGYKWLNNDLVNLFASIFGILFLLIFVGFYA